MLEGRCLWTSRFLWSYRHLELSLAEGLSVELDRGRCSTWAIRSDPLINLSGDVSFICPRLLVGLFKAGAPTDNTLEHGDYFCLHMRLSHPWLGVVSDSLVATEGRAGESESLLWTQLPLAVAELVGEVLCFRECECLAADMR